MSLRLTARPARQLHSLRWETLRLTGDDPPLFTGGNVRFALPELPTVARCWRGTIYRRRLAWCTGAARSSRPRPSCAAPRTATRCPTASSPGAAFASLIIEEPA